LELIPYLLIKFQISNIDSGTSYKFPQKLIII
jgi:hypothetical protein